MVSPYAEAGMWMGRTTGTSNAPSWHGKYEQDISIGTYHTKSGLNLIRVSITLQEEIKGGNLSFATWPIRKPRSMGKEWGYKIFLYYATE
jgi:hypothetical protein